MSQYFNIPTKVSETWVKQKCITNRDSRSSLVWVWNYNWNFAIRFYFNREISTLMNFTSLLVAVMWFLNSEITFFQPSAAKPFNLQVCFKSENLTKEIFPRFLQDSELNKCLWLLIRINISLEVKPLLLN